MWNEKEWHRKYYLKNKERINKQNRENYKNTDKLILQGYKKKYYAKHKNKSSRLCKNYYNMNKDRLSKNSCEGRIRNLSTWEGYIPKQTNCQVCGKEIYFNQRNVRNAIHFDHRNGGIEIIEKPTDWLRKNRRSLDNEKIWRSCNFGMLCKRCNSYLPTKDRIEFIDNVYKYVHGQYHIKNK